MRPKFTKWPPRVIQKTELVIENIRISVFLTDFCTISFTTPCWTLERKQDLYSCEFSDLEASSIFNVL